MRILVADDDRMMSQLVCAIVGKAGHVPIPAYDAMQAVMFAIRPPQPAAIILDINMPGRSGLEALRKLKMSARTSAARDRARSVAGRHNPREEHRVPRPAHRSIDPATGASALKPR